MKKFLSILLMVLYTVSVSASVVSIHFCGTKMEQITIPSFEKKACCCTDTMAMNIATAKQCDAKKEQKPQKTSKTGKNCCADIVLQSRLAADQITGPEIRWVLDHVSLALPARGYHSTVQFFSNRLHQPMVADLKAPPPKIPLYLLFQRFTYYG